MTASRVSDTMMAQKTPRGPSSKVTARAQAVEDGTSVELRVEHRTSPGWLAFWIFVIIATSMLVLPLIPIIMYSHKQQKKLQRDRLIMMHPRSRSTT